MNESEFSERVSESMAGFETVWKRVTSGESAFSDDDTLKGFIHDETCSAAFYTALARMFQSNGRAVLLNHAADAKRHLRRLRAEYFIRTGVSFMPKESCQPVTGKLASLRTALEMSQKAEADYRKASESTAVPELRALYASFAADACARAQENRALLIESF